MFPAMLIAAASVGEAVPRPDFDAVIQACFGRAVNLRLQGMNRLITLLISDHYELPQGIRISSSLLPIAQLHVGTFAAARDNILHFDSAALIVDLSKASIWKCPVRHLGADMRASASTDAWRAAWDLLNERQRKEGTDVVAADVLGLRAGSILNQKLAGPINALISAVGRLDADAASLAAQAVIGLGGGLTPSGDDLLVGFLAGLWAASGARRQRLAFMNHFGDTVLLLRSQTTEICDTYLLHATQGQFSSSLSNLVEAIARGDPVTSAAEKAFRVGHSSGMDAATGLLLGLAAWCPELIGRPIQPRRLRPGRSNHDILSTHA